MHAAIDQRRPGYRPGRWPTGPAEHLISLSACPVPWSKVRVPQSHDRERRPHPQSVVLRNVAHQHVTALLERERHRLRRALGDIPGLADAGRLADLVGAAGRRSWWVTRIDDRQLVERG